LNWLKSASARSSSGLAVSQAQTSKPRGAVTMAALCHLGLLVHMFLDEARIAANLDHNNPVRVYDFGEVDGATT
jgi:serine/threonine protein kinase